MTTVLLSVGCIACAITAMTALAVYVAKHEGPREWKQPDVPPAHGAHSLYLKAKRH